MAKIAIVSDSTCDLPKELVEQEDIKIVPLYIGFNEEVLKDGVDITTLGLYEKVEEICTLLPAFKNEIDFGRGKTIASKDMVRYVFKNGSTLDIMAARQSSRGQRRTGGLMEECILIDGTLLNEVIIPRYWGAVA